MTFCLSTSNRLRMASDAFMQPVFIELALLCYLLTSWLLFLFLPFAPTSSTGLLLWFNTTALCLTCFVCLLARLEMDSSLCVCVQCFSLIVDNRCACWFWLQPCCSDDQLGVCWAPGNQAACWQLPGSSVYDGWYSCYLLWLCVCVCACVCMDLPP